MITLAIIFILLGFSLIMNSLINKNLFINFLGCFVIILSGITIGNKLLKPKVITVNLPEEISQAKENDTLYIVRKTKDTIYIGFRNYKNK